MKNKLLTLLLLIGILCMPVSNCYAKEKSSMIKDNVVSVEKLFDGTTIITILSIYNHDNSQKDLQSKTATKTQIYTNSNNETLWSFSLTGSFIFDGITSACITASHSVYIDDPNWKLTSASSYASGNTAYGNVTMELNCFGFSPKIENQFITLSCDKYGHIY